MKEGALITEFASSKLFEISAEFWVPHQAAHCLAGEAGAGVDGVLFLAVWANLQWPYW